MNREDFEKGVADYDLARTSISLAQEQPATVSPPEGDNLPPKPKTQVAGLGSKIIKKLFGEEKETLINRSSRSMVKNRPKNPSIPKGNDIDKTLRDFGKFQAQDNPEVELADIDTPADIDTLVTKAADAEFPERRNWVEIRSRTSTVKKVMEELRPVTEGRQNGPLTDVQMHGVSRIVATAYDDVERLLPKIASGEATPEELLQLTVAKSTYETMYGYLKGQGSETARALNALKMSKSTLDSRDLAAYKRMTETPNSGLSKYLREWADSINKRMEKGDTIGTAMKWAAATAQHDWIRASVEYWKNNQLSGLKTHIVNNTSVQAYLLYENIVVRPLASAVGAARTGGKTNVDRVQSSELMSPIYSAYAGLRGWMGLFWDNLAKGERNFIAADKVEDSQALSGLIQKSEIIPEGAKTAADVATSASFRILTATDEANRGIAFSQEMYALAARQASIDGLKGKAHVARMNELLNDPPYDMYNQAMDHAAQMTFTDVETRGWIASTSKALRVMTGEIPPLQFIIPYINTPSRLLHVATEMSPLAPLSKRLREDIAAGGAKADIAIAKITAGMGMGVLYWQLYEAAILSGGGPDDYDAQNMLKADGWQPWAIQVDGKAWGMERMEPFSKAAKFTEGLAAFIGYMDKAKYAATDAEKESNVIQGMLSLSQYMLEDQWMEQASGFMKVLEGSESMETYIARTGAGFIPYNAALKSIKEFQDPAKRQLSADKIVSSLSGMLADQIEGNMPTIPGIDYGSIYVRPRRKWDGKVLLPRMSQFASGASPFGPTEMIVDASTKELFENGVIPTEPSSVITLGPKQFSLLQLDDSGLMYDAYIEIVGKERRKIVDEVINNFDFKKLPDRGPGSAASIVLSRAVNAGKRAGLGIFLTGLKDALIKNPELASPLAIKLGEDPVALIEQSLHYLDVEAKDALKGPLKLKPKRKPYEYAIPEMK